MIAGLGVYDCGPLQLDLNNRYRKEVNVYLANQAVALGMAFGENEDSTLLRDYLHKTAQHIEVRFGKNDWRTALLYGLADNNDFCSGGFRYALG